MADKDTDGSYTISDALWQRIEPLLPPLPPRFSKHRPHIDDRQAMEAMFYVLRTGCKWEELPDDLGTENLVHARFREWREAGVFDRMWQVGILTHDELQTLVRQGK